MSTLTALTSADVPHVARLHREAFPAFFLSSLGEPFLVQFYRGFLSDRTALTVVARDSAGRICGAVVGTLEPAGFFGRLLRRQWPGFVAASVTAVVRTPSKAPRLVRALRYRGGAAGGASGALLSSICVDPQLQGGGTGRQLIEAWTREAESRGAPSAYLTTDAEGNENVNAFYLSCGWQLAERFVTPHGRPMNRYTIALHSPDAA